jgi:lipid-binding SYLF domain-containing protein
MGLSVVEQGIDLPENIMRKHSSLQLAAAALVFTACALGGCTTTTTASTSDQRAVRPDIDAGVDSTLSRLYAQVRGSRELVAEANGVLVFPNVIAAGLVVGGEYGKGALRVKGQHAGYYSLAALSVGFQAGAQSKAMAILFMTRDALDKFRASNGWSIGADASVALVKIGANGELDTTTITKPVQVLVLTNAGLMANLNLEGTKITRLD